MVNLYIGELRMRKSLIEDYLKRGQIRIKMLKFLKKEKDYPDVVREAQEVVEILLKALILWAGLEVPKLHDVSKYIEKHLDLFPEIIQQNIKKIRKISRELRKEREMAFYGAEDWIPLEEYTEEDAQRAIKWATEIYELVSKALYPEGKQATPA